ncbi:MAG TPA: M48 family metalloprotease [Natronoarchaeum rubrum]|nr:M48 family metalloprotease [Natronoarchaeum rubrum]
MKRRTGWLWIRMGAIFLAFVALNALFVRTVIWFVTGFVFGVALLSSGTATDLSGLAPPLWVVGVFTALFIAAQYDYSRHRMGGALVDQSYDADLTAFASRRAQQLDVPAPSVYVAEYARPNSMIYGSKRSPTIVLTRGLVDSADEATLDAVVAHELGHLKNGDLWLMTTLNALPILAAKLRAWAAGVRNSVSGGGSDGSPFILFVALGIGALSLSFRAASLLVFRLFSRYREYAADATAAELVGAPEQVAAALSELDADHGPPDVDARERAAGLQQACFLPHGLGERTEDVALDYDVSLQWDDDDEDGPDFFGSDDDDSSGMRWDRVDEVESRNDDQPMQRLERQRAETESATTWIREQFLPDTHPSTADRIDRLQRLRG